MILEEITLQSFRNFDTFRCIFDGKFTILLAPNSSGKTNILEAIYFILSGEGFRESREIELINYHGARDASVEVRFAESDSRLSCKIALVATETTVKKAYFVNGARVTHPQYIRELPRAVLFAPSQIEILTGSPEKRRSYLNAILSSYDFEYKKRVINYETALRKRNKLLEAYSGRTVPDSQLTFWNEYLIEQSGYISSKRKSFIDFVNDNKTNIGKKYRVMYRQNIFSAGRLKEYAALERKICRTVIGPQKDDFEIQDGNDRKNVALFGSRSEQRLAILWLKLSEINYCIDQTGHKPVLLLDDIFSEFDTYNKMAVLKLIDQYQTVATTTEQEIAQLAKIHHSVIRVKS